MAFYVFEKQPFRSILLFSPANLSHCCLLLLYAKVIWQHRTVFSWVTESTGTLITLSLQAGKRYE